MRLRSSSIKAPPFSILLFGGGQRSMFAMFSRGAGGGAKKAADELPRQLFRLKGSSVLAISRGDLTQWEGDAIVNAANERMLGGGGVDGAIHRAAGPQLVEACYRVKIVAPNVRCPTGEARLTNAFRLKAKVVIHTVGPIYESHEESAPILANAYKNTLLLCRETGLKTIAFPAISCGIYGYPQDEAAKVSIATIMEFCEGIDLVEFVLFGQDTYNPFVAEASRVLKRVSENTPEDDHAEAAESEKEATESEEHAMDADNVKQPEEESRAEEPTPQENEVDGEVISRKKLLAKASTEPSAGVAPVADQGKADAMDVASVKWTYEKGEDGVAEREAKVVKGDQPVAEVDNKPAGGATNTPASTDDIAGSSPDGSATGTPTQADGQSTGADEKNKSGIVVNSAVTPGVSMAIESQGGTIALNREGPGEGRRADAGAGIEAEAQESQETVLMDDSNEEMQDMASEAPSESGAAEAGSCSTTEAPRPVRDNEISRSR